VLRLLLGLLRAAVKRVKVAELSHRRLRMVAVLLLLLRGASLSPQSRAGGCAERRRPVAVPGGARIRRVHAAERTLGRRFLARRRFFGSEEEQRRGGVKMTGVGNGHTKAKLMICSTRGIGLKRIHDVEAGSKMEARRSAKRKDNASGAKRKKSVVTPGE
jgi:hypothetical protein